MTKRSAPAGEAGFGVVGLGVMGANLARNIARHGTRVVAHDLDAGKVARLAATDHGGAIEGARDAASLVARLARPRRILVMVPAGKAVDAVIGSLAPLLDEGDVLIDGGNSYFRDTARRQQELEGRGLHLLGVGISGGAEGALHGPSLMAGGPRRGYTLVAPVLESIAARSDAGPCVAWFGPHGAGHFVKMVHNGIEYGDMQVIAEVYDLARRLLRMEPGEIAELFGRWNRGRLSSFLVEITAAILAQRDSGVPVVERILDRAGQKGTGRWTARDAVDMGEAVPTLTAAVDARVLSSLLPLRREAARALPPRTGSADLDAGDLEQAFFAARVCAYAQGFRFIQLAAEAFGWPTDPAAVARVWRAGCIIRAALLEPIEAAYRRDGRLPHLLLDPELAREVAGCQAGWRRTVAAAAVAGVPAPAIAASLAYFDALRAERLPQNLTQAQRDFFGAHGFRYLEDADGAPLRHRDWRA